MKAANWLSSVPHLRPLQRFLMNPPAEVARFATEKCGNLSGHSDIMVSLAPGGSSWLCRCFWPWSALLLQSKPPLSHHAITCVH
jgi:hypothetical protein